MQSKINRNTILFACLAFLALSLVTCTRDPVNDSSLYTVSGTVYQCGQPLQAAKVSLDNAINYTSFTDADGYFELHDVPEGTHELLVTKSFDDTSYTTRTGTIEVVSDVILNAFILPRAVTLYEITSVTHDAVELAWSPTDAHDFREYKLYRHTTSGLDETTGTLVHVSTTIFDTAFADTHILPYQQYYYRVYIMNHFGAMGGSNIVSTSTQSFNILVNGDFEAYDAVTQLPLGWNERVYYYSGGYTAPPAFSIDSLHAQNGKYCVKADLVDVNVYMYGLQQQLNVAHFVTGQHYRLSLWIKNFPEYTMIGGVRIFDEENGGLYDNDILQSASPSTDWQEFTMDMYISKDVTSTTLNMNIGGWQGPLVLYLDNFSLIRITQ